MRPWMRLILSVTSVNLLTLEKGLAHIRTTHAAVSLIKQNHRSSLLPSSTAEAMDPPARAGP